jgi:hypothetical protein
MKRLTNIKSLIAAGLLFLLMNPITVASDLIEPTRTLSSPAENTAELSVFSEPDGLDVDLDGASIGKTPVVGLKVEPGSHVIRLQGVRTEIDTEAGEAIRLSWFKGTFIQIPAQKEEGLPEQSEEKKKTLQTKSSERSTEKKEKPNPLYWPLNPVGPIY